MNCAAFDSFRGSHNFRVASGKIKYDEEKLTLKSSATTATKNRFILITSSWKGDRQREPQKNILATARRDECSFSCD